MNAQTQIGRLNPDDSMQTKQLYPRYCQFCDGTGLKPIAQNQFTAELISTADDMGHTLTKNRESNKSRRSFIAGIKLIETPESGVTGGIVKKTTTIAPSLQKVVVNG